MTTATTSLRDQFAAIRANPLFEEAQRRAQYLRVAKQFREAALREQRERHYAGAPGSSIVEAITASVDTLLREIYDLALLERRGAVEADPPCALVALGGYGRGTLSPCSDLDVMLVHERRLTGGIESLNSFLLYFLWDTGFKVGHSVRSIADAARFAQLDDTAKTAMLESRLVAGNAATFEKYQETIFRQVRAKGVDKFIAAKQREREKVYRELGSDVYAREPHVKQSAGGLRDYQTGIWIAIAKFGLRTPRELWHQGLISEETFLRLDLALDFLYRVRTHLHFEVRLQDDLLTLERQEQLARAFSYEATDVAAAVQLFMQDYYQNAEQLHRFYLQMLTLGRKSSSRLRAVMAKLTTEQLDRGLTIANQQVLLPEQEEAWFREEPVRLFEVVWYIQKYGLELTERAAGRIRANADLIDEEFRRSPVARDYFLAMLNSAERAGASLRLLDALGLLERYLPEFGDIRGVVRYDGFHQFTVEEHTLRAVENLGTIGQLEDKSAHVLKGVLEALPRPDLLALGILLHDIGKLDQNSHINSGVAIARQIGARLGLPEEDIVLIVFLIRQHLMMTKLSQYRDMDDPKIIEDFAAEIGTVEQLNHLYVLTYCDVTAVREGLWTDWKSALLLQLYLRTRAVLTGTEAFDLQPAALEAKRKAVRDLVPADAASMVDAHLERMRPQYFRAFQPEEIAEQIKMIRRLEGRELGLHFQDKEQLGCSVITVVTRDRPRLFAMLVGALASLQVNILGAGIFTRDDGLVIDVFRVADGRRRGPLGQEMWETVRRRLRQVLTDGRDVDELLQRMPATGPLRRTPLAATRLSVTFDNHVSDSYTVIDLEAGDRIGLLYDVASTLAELQIDLALAKVTTDVRQARDAFYVSKRDGGKITSPDELETLRGALLAAAAGEPAERSA